MQLAGVRLSPKNRLHFLALKKAWSLKRRARESALQAILAVGGKEASTAVAAMTDYFEAEHPEITYKNMRWDVFARDFLEKKGWME